MKMTSKEKALDLEDEIELDFFNFVQSKHTLKSFKENCKLIRMSYSLNNITSYYHNICKWGAFLSQPLIILLCAEHVFLCMFLMFFSVYFFIHFLPSFFAKKIYREINNDVKNEKYKELFYFMYDKEFKEKEISENCLSRLKDALTSEEYQALKTEYILKKLNYERLYSLIDCY